MMKTFVNSAFCCLSMLMALVTMPTVLCEGSGKAELFFNSAVEEYLNENYELALEAVRKSIELDPENERVKGFAIKLLLQMVAKAHLERHHEKAMKLLEEARGIDPQDERVNKLYLMIQQEPGPQEGSIPQAKKAAPAPALKDLLRRSASPPALKAAERTKPSSPASADSSGTGASSRPLPKASKRGSPPASARGGSASGRKQRPSSLPSATAFSWKIIALVSALAFICIGAAFVYLRRLQNRLQCSLKDVREVEKEFEQEKKQIREEKQRMETETRERAMREKESREREDEGKRRADKEKQEHLRQEQKIVMENALGRKERERFKLEDQQRKKFNRMIEKERPAAKKAEDAKDVHEEILIIETSTISREQAYKRLASRFKDIYELDKEKAVDFITPLLGDSDPRVRAYVAGGVSQLPVPESVDILFRLWKDPDMKVKAESLKGIHNFYKRPDFARIFPEKLRLQIKGLIEQEKLKGEWLL